MAEIKVTIPDHLVNSFLGYMSDGGGEYGFMETYQSIDERVSDTYVKFDYSWEQKTIDISIIKEE